MQFKQTGLLLFFLSAAFPLFAQTTYLPQGGREQQLLERLEIKLQTDTVLNFSKTRPFSRRHVIPALQGIDTSRMTAVDRYNTYITQLGNLEWVDGDRAAFQSKKPLLKHFFKTPATLYEVNTKDFFLSVNPVFQFYAGREKGYGENIFLNTRGVALRGRIANKIGFAAYITENQERVPRYVQSWVEERQAVPGQGFYKDFKVTAYDYFDARGYISFNAAKYIDIVFGYDRNFIGNGHRSLFLSDFSSSALFLKLNTRIWKFNYQNLFMELQNPLRNTPADVLIPKKYAAMHHLDLAVTRWLNIGLFEGVVFGRNDHFEFGYLNPVIFYRSIEQQNGSFDNAVAGLDAKANIAGRFQLYGQLLLDEFKLSEIRAGKGWWANKIGYQLGVKSVDFPLENLDLQLEFNRVRPFTYSHRDSTANYTHYNQPLAHPLGANFNEIIGLLRYQPAPRWNVQLHLMHYMQGRDSSALSYGSNIFLPNVPPYRNSEYGFSIGSGERTNVVYGSLLVSYEFRPNLFFEIQATGRREKNSTSSATTSFITSGVRWNMNRRMFDF